MHGIDGKYVQDISQTTLTEASTCRTVVNVKNITKDIQNCHYMESLCEFFCSADQQHFKYLKYG
jgi:hypothetical protein